HISCVELPNTVTHESIHQVREHSEQPLCSLLGEWDNQTSLMIKYHAMMINHDHPKSKSKV
ncbi:hypothetical protein, partial [Ekhidna sp.]